ncbi:MAG: response regulator [Deltaproteobacteria bacterium]|nr:response regulator [Deltaproteobacteria bacterium]MBN2673906.1 response regulator [Deltaproteobacteria bacterium]
MQPYYPILLISPNSPFFTELQHVLSENGYFVIAAHTLRQSLEAINAGVYSLAIVPTKIDGGAGTRLVKKIKQIWGSTHIVVVDDGSLERAEYEHLCTTHCIDHIVSPSATSEEVALISARLIGAAPPMTRIPGFISTIGSAPPYDIASASGTATVPPVPDEHAPAQSHDISPFCAAPSIAPAGAEDPLALEILQLAREYQKTLPDELHRLKELLREARQTPEDAEESIMAVRQLTHTISGTAGTLGFTEVGEIVRQINDKIKKIEQKKGGTEDEWETLFYLADRAISTPERSSLMPAGITAGADIGTVLVLDEDRSALTDLYEVGRSCLVGVIPACTRVEALAEIESSDIDGVIIDVDMSNLDPTALVSDLRALEGKEDLQIAFMATQDTVDKRILAASAGAMQFLQKPLTEDTLVEIAREFSQQRVQTNATVVIVDDDPFFRKHINNILTSEHLDVHEVDEPERILEILDPVQPDIVLLDVQMPTISGFDVCRMIRSVPKWRNLPILFLTGESDAKVRIECFTVGGDDYIQKPCIKEELLARINVRLERIRLFKERADKDPLTRLLNRRAFLEQFDIRLDEGRRYDRPLSFCVIDLDKFKHVNDTYGHLAGDRVLQAMGKLLLSRFRKVDIRGRWGGEEFAVAFYNEEANTAKKLLFEALKALRKLVFTGDGGEQFQVTFSAGVATFPQDATDFDTLFKIADENLYEAKEAGRNRIYTQSDVAVRAEPATESTPQ